MLYLLFLATLHALYSLNYVLNLLTTFSLYIYLLWLNLIFYVHFNIKTGFVSLVTWVCLLKYYSPVVPTSTTQLSLLCNWNTLDKDFSSGRLGKSLLTIKVLPLRQFELFPAFYKPTNINSKYISDLFPIIQWANEISHGPTSWYGWLDNDEKQAKISSPFQGFLCKPTWDLTLHWSHLFLVDIIDFFKFPTLFYFSSF